MIPCDVCGGQPCREGCRIGHQITRGGAQHDAECTCGWWADAGGTALDHYIAHHQGRPVEACDLECCEAA